jgi:hypothetical protein
MSLRRALVLCSAATLGVTVAVVPSMAAEKRNVTKRADTTTTTVQTRTEDDAPTTTSGTTSTGTATAPDAGTTSGDTTSTPTASTEAEPLPAPASPVLGRDVTLAPVSGIVKVRRPGDMTAVALGDAHQLPTGTLIDARAGAVSLRSAVTATASQTGTFAGGVFTVRQASASRSVTQLVLSGGSFTSCPRTTSRAQASAARAPRVVRRLWGRDHGGRFTTVGRGSAATVRGTRWLTEDRCDGTRTAVVAGAVSVMDRRTHRRVLVRAGHSLLVEHR